MLKKLGFIFLFVFLVSCNKTNTETKDLPEINYTTVDAFPLLSECEPITNRGLQRACFYRELTKKIQYNLSIYKISDEFVNDTIYAKIFIDNKGNSFYKNATVSNVVLDSILTESIQKLPKMNPAIKKGIPVNIEFTLPIIIN